MNFTRLVDCLRDFGPTDWQLACLVCKTLWNFSENITNASSCFGNEDTNTLLLLLSSFLGKALDYGESVSFIRVWDSFFLWPVQINSSMHLGDYISISNKSMLKITIIWNYLKRLNAIYDGDRRTFNSLDTIMISSVAFFFFFAFSLKCINIRPQHKCISLVQKHIDTVVVEKIGLKMAKSYSIKSCF